MDNLVSLLQAVGTAGVNADVRSKMLELIQSWAAATEGRYELSYIGEVYRSLQREGYQFPPRQSVASSMIDSSAVRLDPRISLLSCFTVTNEVAAPRMGRLGCLYAMPDTIYVYEPKAPLQELR